MKKKKTKKAKSAKKKKLTCIQFLRDLYGADSEISNAKALHKLRARFPESRADVKAIVTWKNMLRAEGIKIPKREAASTKKKKKKKKKKKRQS